VIVRFVDIDGIVDHHCLDFLFIKFIAIILSVFYLFFLSENAQTTYLKHENILRF